MKYRVQNTVNNEYLDDDDIFLLPNGEVGWFIRDGSYPHYRKFRHQEDFKVINTDCERLQGQLKIAVKALRGIRVWANVGNGGEQAVKKLCDKVLKEIEELNEIYKQE